MAQQAKTWTERIEVAGNELVDQVKELIAEGNVRRLIIRTPNDDFRVEIPLTAGVAVGGVLAVFTPVLAAVGALAALVAKVNLEIEREDDEAANGEDDEDEDDDGDEDAHHLHHVHIERS